MKLERVLFPDHAESSWGKTASLRSSSRNAGGENSNRRDKPTVRRGKRQQQKHKVGKKDRFVSVLMNLDENQPGQRTKKNTRSSKQDSNKHKDSQNQVMETTQSSLALNKSKSSIHVASELLLQSLGATDSLLFLGGSNVVSGRKSTSRRSKRERASKPGTKRAREIVTKQTQEPDIDPSSQDISQSGPLSDKRENTIDSNTEDRIKESSGASSQPQQRSRRPKRQRESNDLEESYQAQSEGKEQKPTLDNTSAEKYTRPKDTKNVKFARQTSEQRRGKRTKGKLHISSGGLNSLCGLDNHGFSFPVPDPVLNRSVLVSPLSVESLDPVCEKNVEPRSNKAKKSARQKGTETKPKTKETGVQNGNKKETAKQNSTGSKSERPISKNESRKAGARASNRITPKKPLDQFESEPESTGASFSPESNISLSHHSVSRQLPHVSSTNKESMPINGCSSNPFSKAANTKESRIAKSRRLVNMSQSWNLDSLPDQSCSRVVLGDGPGAYVLEVEEVDLSRAQKVRNLLIEQSQSKASKSSKSDSPKVSTENKEPSDMSNDKENIIEKKPIQKKRSTAKLGNTEKKISHKVREFGRPIEGNVKPSGKSALEKESGSIEEKGEKPTTVQPSKQSTRVRESAGIAEKEDESTTEPTPLQRSTRARRSSRSNDDGEKCEEQTSAVRRSRRSVGRPRRFGEYEGDDDSAYVPTPATETISKKRPSRRNPAKKEMPKPRNMKEVQEEARESEIDTNQWTKQEILILREAQNEVDPKSYSYWQDVADLVPGRSAEECQEKWFSLAKTPNVRQKKKKEKEASKETPMSPEDDDIFDATPMKALFATSSGDDDPLMGSMGFLSQLNLGSGVKVDRVPVVNPSNSLATARGYKSYIKDMKREVHAKTKKPKLPKKGNSKGKNLREQAEEGDVELKARLSPGGTLHMTSNVDVDMDDGYDMDEESDDGIDSVYPRIQPQFPSSKSPSKAGLLLLSSCI